MGKKEILALIPAKGTSRGLPAKNLHPFMGKPLFYWSVKAAKESGFITRVVVSSESDKILNLAQEYGSDIVERPVELAQDDSRAEEVIIDALSQLHEDGYRPDILILLQPTSPLRNSDDIDAALSLFFAEKGTALISGFTPGTHPLKNFIINKDGCLTSILDDRHPFANRQTLPPAFCPNGAIFIIQTDLFLRKGLLLTEKTIPFYMDAKRSIDIDTLESLVEAEEFIRGKC